MNQGFSDVHRLEFELYAKLPVFQRKIDRSKNIIEEAVQKHSKWALSFSGGIDSTVLLDLLYSNGYRVDVQWGDDGWDFDEVLEFLATTERQYGFELQRIQCLDPWNDWCDELGRQDLMVPLIMNHYSKPLPSYVLDAWHNPHRWHSTWNSLQDARFHGYGGIFLGMLAKESVRRSYILHGGARATYQVAREDGTWHCSPLAHWDKRDVWSYILSRSLPYNKAYNTLIKLNIPIKFHRTAPLTCFRVHRYGGIVTLRQGWPELYNKLSATFPKVREYS